MLKLIQIFMIKFLTKHKRNLSIFGVVASLAAMTVSSCTQVDNTLGSDLIDPSMRDSVKIDSSFSLSAFTVEGTKIRGTFGGTTYGEYGWLGSYNDPTFGRVDASIALQFLPVSISAYKKFAKPMSQKIDSLIKLGIPGGVDATEYLLGKLNVDKMIFSFKLNKGVGDSLATQTMRIMQLKDTIPNKLQYTDSDVADKLESNPLSSDKTYNRKANDAVKIDFSKKFILSLLQNIDTTETIKDYLTFINYFKGFYLQHNTLATGGSLNQVNFGDTASYVKLYYRIYGKNQNTATEQPDSTLALTFDIGSSCHKVNIIKHDYSNATAKPKKVSEIVENATGEPINYLQGLGGMRTMVRFDKSSIEAWKANNKDANVHRAELIVEIPDGPIDYYRQVKAITPYFLVSDTVRFVNDMYTYVNVSSNSRFNRSKKNYSVNITSFFKDAMRGTKPMEFYIYGGYPSGLSSSTSTSVSYRTLTDEYMAMPTQSIIGTTNSKKRPYRLVITYSK